jgi:hypothetical protein
MAINELNPKVLGQLLLMQSIVINLPDNKSIFSFICKGLKDVPGIKDVRHNIHVTKNKDKYANNHYYPISTNNNYGELEIVLNNLDLFSLYNEYIENFVFMIGVILQERHQRQINENYQLELEEIIKIRTSELQLEKENLQKQYGFVAPSDICSHISEILKLSLPSNAQIFLSEMVDFMVFVNTSDYEIFLTSLKSVIEKIEFSQIPVGNKRSYKPQLLISIMQLNNARPARASELFDLSQSLIKFHNGKKNLDKILQISLDPLTKDDYAKLDFEELQKKGLLNYNFLDKRGSYE